MRVHSAFFGLASLVGLLGFGGACSAKTPDTVVVKATGGLDTAPFAGDPAVARVELRVRDDKGAETVVATANPATGGIDVPDSVRSSGVGSVVLAGIGADASLLAYGRSPTIALEGIDNNALKILVQRPSTVVRALNLVSAVAAPRVDMLGARYLLVSDPTSTTIERVDLVTLAAAEERTALDVTPSIMVSSGDYLLAVDGSGSASLYLTGSSTETHPTAPSGSSYADVLGGDVVLAEDGAAYVVGATRSTSPSDVVLRLGDDGTITFKKLLRPRIGANAVWALGRGLVILGGISPTGIDSPGVELLATGQSIAVPLPFPSDVTTKATAAALTGTLAGSVVRVDEAGVVQVFDLACTASCTPTVNGAKADAVTARPDDTAVALELGGMLSLRGGKLVRIDTVAGTATTLADLGVAQASMTLMSTGAAAVVVAGDPVLRTIR